MNVSHLVEPELLARLEAMWVEEEHEAAATGQDTTSLFLKGLYKSK